MKPYRPDPDKLTNMLFVVMALLVGILCYVTGVFERMSADLKGDKLNIPVVEASANDTSSIKSDNISKNNVKVRNEVWEFNEVPSTEPTGLRVILLKRS